MESLATFLLELPTTTATVASLQVASTTTTTTTPTCTSTSTSTSTSTTISSTSLQELVLQLPAAAVSREVVRAAEVEVVGGDEATLARVAFMLARLQVDPHFYRHQMKLYNWRSQFLFKVGQLDYHEETEEGFVITQRFVEEVEKVMVGDQGKRRVNTRVAEEAAARFCWFEECPGEHLMEVLACHQARAVIQALHRQGPPSLVELGARRVVALRMALDGLPRELRALVRGGPGEVALTPRGQQIMEEVEQASIDWHNREEEDYDEEEDETDYDEEEDETEYEDEDFDLSGEFEMEVAEEK